MLRIGEITYANCTPIFATLKNNFDCSDYVFVRGVPSELNSALAAGEIDICISSSVELAKHPETYSFLADLSISSIGAVKSVFLLSRPPIDKLDRCTIGLTRESATSVNLLKVILGMFYGLRNDFEWISSSDRDPTDTFPAVLLIGDAALRAGTSRVAGMRIYDLGEEWRRFTGLPFVFALWLARRDVLLRQAGEFRILHNRLREAKRLAYRSLADIAARCCGGGFSPAELGDYWKCLSYDLTPRHLAGLRAFFGYLVEVGMISRLPQMRSSRWDD